MENNKPIELTFDKPEDFLTPQEKISQVLKVVEGLKDLQSRYADNKEMLDQINFRLNKQGETLDKLGYEAPQEQQVPREVADMDEAIDASSLKTNNNADAWRAANNGETLH